MTLNNMKPGEVGTIESINGDHHLQTRLVELGPSFRNRNSVN
jgi:Fe2+ transport system protein FeoA